MAVTADRLNSRRPVQRAVQALGFVALLALAAGTGLTASGAHAGNPGNLPGSEAAMAHGPTLTSTPDPCDPVWSVFSSPNVGTGNNSLNGVAAVSANDVWAVGNYRNSNNTSQTETARWNGTDWSLVSSPNSCCGDNYLTGVASVSANDVWAVGYYYNSSNIAQTLIEHWNGTAWSVVPSPNVGTIFNGLYGVAAASANDVWAVGYFDNDSGGPYLSLIEHWDGTAWSVVPSPNPGTRASTFSSVTAVSANDVWAVGSYYTNSPPPILTMVQHWDGTSWSVVPSPNVGGNDNHLYGVAAVSANDVWAVGYYFNGSVFQTQVQHWNGTAWSVVPSPNVGTSNTYLSRVAVVSATDVWAVGNYQNGTGPYRSLIVHWDGTSWSVVPSPNPSTTEDSLSGIAAVAADDVWGVGRYLNGSGVYQTLVERYASLCGTPTSTPTDTPTPSPPTNTPTPGGFVYGHLTWQQVAASNYPSATGTLRLCVSGTPQNYGPFNTDTSGNFTLTTGLPDGVYHWFIKGGRHISNSSPTDGGDLVISGGVAHQEFGLQKAGDIVSTPPNQSNIVNSVDFGNLKGFFGKSGALAADLDYNLIVNALDFNILKTNFGQSGHILTCP